MEWLLARTPVILGSKETGAFYLVCRDRRILDTTIAVHLRPSWSKKKATSGCRSFRAARRKEDRVEKARFWLLVSLAVTSRVVSFFFLKAEPAYVFVPRSFVGGGFQTLPALLDLVVPVIVIYCLWPGRRFDKRTIQSGRLAIWDATSFLLFPLVAGLSLFAYEAPWQILPNVTLATFLRWLQFMTSYLAWNLLLDELSVKSRWQRFATVPILVLSLGLLQDAFPGINDPFAVLLSVGLTLTWTVLAFRRRYCQSPLVATLAAAIVGGVSCLLIVMGPTNSAFPPLLMLIAFLAGALTIRSGPWWSRWVALACIAAVGLLLSLAFPRFLPPAERAAVLQQEPPSSHTKEVEGVTVRYDDDRVRNVAMRLAHVLAAANQVSQEDYGISPQADELVVQGFAEGGFQAEFPHRIRGNFLSQGYVDLCLDSSFLNDPQASIHFPDPVNAILHEFSHLYGSVPYQAWEAEEEGWATFSATRLSRRLYERFGSGLWNPAYNYAARADAITQSNLAGHPVEWSHPNEYGGFRLWYLLSQRDGEVAIYRKRWALTRRDWSWWLQVNDPGAARRVARAFGFEDFVFFGSGKVVRYDQVYALQDAKPVGELRGWPAEKIKAYYDRNANRLIDPTVRVPARRPLVLDMALSLVLLALFVVMKRVTPSHGPPGELQ